MSNSIQLRDDQCIIIAPVELLNVDPAVSLFGPLAVNRAMRRTFIENARDAHIFYGSASSVEAILSRTFANTNDIREFVRLTGFTTKDEIGDALAEIWRNSAVQTKFSKTPQSTAKDDFALLAQFVADLDEKQSIIRDPRSTRIDVNAAQEDLQLIEVSLAGWMNTHKHYLLQMGLRKPFQNVSEVCVYSSFPWRLKDLNDEVYLGVRMRSYPNKLKQETLDLLNDELPGVKELIVNDPDFSMLGVVEFGCFSIETISDSLSRYTNEYALDSNGDHLSSRFYIFLRRSN